MFKHSVKVPRLYKIAAKIAKEVNEGIGSVKYLVYESGKKHPNIKALYALVTTLFQRNSELECILKKSQFFTKEPRADPWLSKILIVELLWGTKRLSGDSTPETTVKSYEQIFKAHLSDISLVPTSVNDTKGNFLLLFTDIMVEDTDVTEPVPYLPPHTKRAVKAFALLLFFSLLMFSLPFGAFFGVKYFLKDYFHITNYANTVWSVVAAVITVNLIIFSYAYIAYHEPEYDDEGNLINTSINTSTKSHLNLKEE